MPYMHMYMYMCMHMCMCMYMYAHVDTQCPRATTHECHGVMP